MLSQSVQPNWHNFFPFSLFTFIKLQLFTFTFSAAPIKNIKNLSSHRKLPRVIRIFLPLSLILITPSGIDRYTQSITRSQEHTIVNEIWNKKSHDSLCVIFFSWHVASTELFFFLSYSKYKYLSLWFSYFSWSIFSQLQFYLIFTKNNKKTLNA